MWDDDFFRNFYRNRRGQRTPFDMFNVNKSYTFDIEKFFSIPPESSPKFTSTKYLTITVSEGDDDGIDKAIALLESMKSKGTDPAEVAKSDAEEGDENFDAEFKKDNL